MLLASGSANVSIISCCTDPWTLHEKKKRSEQATDVFECSFAVNVFLVAYSNQHRMKEIFCTAWDPESVTVDRSGNICGLVIRT
jgi:hypothetical protein